MPDGAMLSGLTRSTAPTRRFRQRWVSPLLRRILLVNALPLALLVVALLYLDQYQNGLLEAQVAALARTGQGVRRRAGRKRGPDHRPRQSQTGVRSRRAPCCAA